MKTDYNIAYKPDPYFTTACVYVKGKITYSERIHSMLLFTLSICQQKIHTVIYSA